MYTSFYRFVEDLAFISKAHRVDIASLQEEMSHFNKGLKLIEQELETFGSTNQRCKFHLVDRYQDVMEPFASKCRDRVAGIQAMFEDIENKTVEACKYFGSEGKELSELLNIWDTFCTDYLETKVELQQMKQDEEKEKRKEELKVMDEEKKRKKAELSAQKAESSVLLIAESV
jgi:hypothetical protein